MQEGIDSEALAALDDVQLKELGVKRMGDRTKVISLFFVAPSLNPATLPPSHHCVFLMPAASLSTYFFPPHSVCARGIAHS